MVKYIIFVSLFIKILLCKDVLLSDIDLIKKIINFNFDVESYIINLSHLDIALLLLGSCKPFNDKIKEISQQIQVNKFFREAKPEISCQDVIQRVRNNVLLKNNIPTDDIKWVLRNDETGILIDATEQEIETAIWIDYGYSYAYFHQLWPIDINILEKQIHVPFDAIFDASKETIIYNIPSISGDRYWKPLKGLNDNTIAFVVNVRQNYFSIHALKQVLQYDIFGSGLVLFFDSLEMDSWNIFNFGSINFKDKNNFNLEIKNTDGQDMITFQTFRVYDGFLMTYQSENDYVSCLDFSNIKIGNEKNEFGSLFLWINVNENKMVDILLPKSHSRQQIIRMKHVSIDFKCQCNAIKQSIKMQLEQLIQNIDSLHITKKNEEKKWIDTINTGSDTWNKFWNHVFN